MRGNNGDNPRAPQQFRKPQQHHQCRLKCASAKHHAVRRRREYFPAMWGVGRGAAEFVQGEDGSSNVTGASVPRLPANLVDGAQQRQPHVEFGLEPVVVGGRGLGGERNTVSASIVTA